jgi:hypothetical protein
MAVRSGLEPTRGASLMLKMRNTVIYRIFVICCASKFESLVSVQLDERCTIRMQLIRTHLQDLKDVTSDVHYESFRAQQLFGRRNLNDVYE